MHFLFSSSFYKADLSFDALSLDKLSLWNVCLLICPIPFLFCKNELTRLWRENIFNVFFSAQKGNICESQDLFEISFSVDSTCFFFLCRCCFFLLTCSSRWEIIVPLAVYLYENLLTVLHNDNKKSILIQLSWFKVYLLLKIMLFYVYCKLQS